MVANTLESSGYFKLDFFKEGLSGVEAKMKTLYRMVTTDLRVK